MIPPAFRQFGRAEIRIGANRLPEVIRWSGSAIDPGRGICLVLRDAMFGHYFHTVETCLAVYALQQAEWPAAPIERIVPGHIAWDNPRQDRLQSQLIKVVFADPGIVGLSAGETLELENVLLLDRALGRNKYGKLLYPMHASCRRAAASFRGLVRAALLPSGSAGGPAEPAGRRRALYVKRSPPRCLAADAEAELLGRLAVQFDVQSVDFAGMSFADQIQTVSQFHLVAGVHGNGLTNLFWLPDHACVLELFPEGVHHYDYQMLAEIAGLDYWGLEAANIFRPFSRIGPPYGHNAVANKMVAAIDHDALSTVLQVLADGHPGCAAL